MRFILKIHSLIINSSTFRQYALLFLLGGSAALALPPFSFWPALIPAFTVLIWLTNNSTSWQKSFFCGWWFGFGHFIAGLYWITLALLTDVNQYGWLIPFAVLSISAALACYAGLAALATHLMPIQGESRKVILFAISWVITEILRTHLFTGFPWNLTGYSWARSTEIMQLASFTGIEGLSFISILIGGIATTLIRKDFTTGTMTINSWKPVILTGLFLALIWTGGYLRLPSAASYPTTDVTLRIIQPNISQDHKWQPELRFNTLKRHMDLSNTAATRKPAQFLIWPEAAVPYTLFPHSDLVSMLKELVPPNGFLLTGALRETEENEPYHLWNSLFAIDSTGNIVASYDKVHLVPFGEYIPLRYFLPINKLTYGTTDFSTGTEATTLSASLRTPSFGALICYEAIFPEGIVNPKNRPSWLINITNDAWFGMSSGPYQHFQMVRMRSIEQGLPLVRAANTGISAIIDAYGRITASLPLGKEAILEGNLPAPLPPTPYSRFGNYIIFLLIFGIGLLLSLTHSTYNSKHITGKKKYHKKVNEIVHFL